ncbi:MAG: bifunctional metallophosphatase/5'-nucleotidase [Bacteroidales bacterium]|nr:bifunctional metallophosphatase/5'-nucleotidase [Bacteroidales bacterium]
MKTTTLKKITGNGLLTLLLLSLILATGCGIKRKTTTAGEISQTDRTVEILAVNDMHAAIDNFPRFAFMVDSLRAIYPHMLLFSGGDNQTGNPVNDQYPQKGLPMIELMNALQFDLSSIGNHEFDSKLDGFSFLTHQADFPFVCANLDPPEELLFRIDPYKIITLPNGVRLVITSVLHINEGGIPDTHPENVQGFSFTDPFETAAGHLHLRDSGDLLIFLNHFGFENDVELALQLPPHAIDIIIGAHSHTKVDKEQLHNGILITQAERKLKYATLIKFVVKPNGTVERSMQLLTVGENGSERADIRAMVDRYNDNPVLKEQIAVAEDGFSSYEQVGYLMVDALRATTKADIALINPGGVRIDHLPRGPVSVLNIYSMDPFGNETVLLNLTGEEIRSMHINAFKLDEFLPIYPSGMTTRYTLHPDGNVKEVHFFMPDGSPLNMKKSYTVVMNNYMASVYQYEHQDPGTGLFLPTAESLIEYLRTLKQIPSYRDEKRVEIR